MKLPKFNKNLFIGVLLIIIFVLLGLFGCISMTGGKYNPLCPPCDQNKPHTTPTLTPTPTPDTNTTPTPTPNEQPTPTPTQDAPDVSCGDYSFNDCSYWAASQEMTHFGLTTNTEDCTAMGTSYCTEFGYSIENSIWSQTAPVCCCGWKCIGE